MRVRTRSRVSVRVCHSFILTQLFGLNKIWYVNSKTSTNTNLNPDVSMRSGFLRVKIYFFINLIKSSARYKHGGLVF